MALQVFDTLAGKKRAFETIEDKHVRLYTCGPTVYDYAHIGNFRAYIFEDLLRRYLQYKGYVVTQVMNLTDIDDKTIAGALTQDASLNEYTKPYIDAFFEDLRKLNIEDAEHYPRATDYIQEMIDLVQTLLDKGYAYESEGSVYYRIRKFSEYGKLSKKKIDENVAGTRVDHDEYERDDVRDFVLWKKKKDGEPFWPSPFGDGRPGWHIECSAMSIKLLGETFDIHTGGEDNIFPHHENEIAQSEAATGKPFSHYWMHCKFLLVNNEKMSKSKGNFYTLRDLMEKGYDPIAIRYLLLSHNYNHPLNFTLQGIDAAKASIKRIVDFRKVVSRCDVVESGDSCSTEISTARLQFEAALDDDLNIAKALGVVFDFVSTINKKLVADAGITAKAQKEVLAVLVAIDTVLGVLGEGETAVTDIPAEIMQYAEDRKNAKKEKDFQKADALRAQVSGQGWNIIDLPGGEYTIEKK